MKVAVIGAGVSGVVNARVLASVGVDVTVYEACPDIGGVWSSTRGYPGLRIQNDKRTYALSELPMPVDYPEHPTAPHVQQYLADYAARFGLTDLIRFDTTVTSAAWNQTRSAWVVQSRGPAGPSVDEADWLILANGINSVPNEPDLPGIAEFTAAGGVVVEASSLGTGEVLRGRRVAVLGWGKSAADIAVAAADRGAEVTVIARHAAWKLPYRIGRIPFQRLVISRMGEHLLWSPYRTIVGRVLRRMDETPRRWFVDALERRVRAQLLLTQRNLDPGSSIKDFSHLMTHGLMEAIDDGRITLHRGAGIDGLLSDRTGPTIRLTDRAVIRADVLVTATGYRQDVSFLDEETQQRLLNDRGELQLYRHTEPQQVRNLLFAGWTNSFRSPLASEIQALWIAALMHGVVRRPGGRKRAQHAQVLQLTQDRARINGRPQFSSGVSILDQDAWIREAGLRMPFHVMIKELLRPVDPRDYSRLHRRLRRRLERRGVAAATSTRRSPRISASEPAPF